MNHKLYDEATPLIWLLDEALKEHPQKAYFTERGRKLIRMYTRLPVGDFLVIGVPQGMLSAWVYDSKPYNLPTGIDIAAMVERPRDFQLTLLKEGAHMATIIMCKETLDPETGVTIIEANDRKATRAYVDGIPLQPLPALFQELMDPTDPAIEEDYEETRSELNSELDKLSLEFSGKLQFKFEKLSDQKSDWQASDIRELAI
jgi:hypothetical protein